MKTSELTGAALNWAVGKAEGLDDWLAPVNYCGKWEHGGPIIEREIISVSHDTAGSTIEWAAWTPAPIRDDAEAFGYGPTPLIAAMRCYVASTLGDEVSLSGEFE